MDISSQNQAWAEWIHAFDLFAAETEAILKCVRSAKAQGYLSIQIRTDCKLAIEAIYQDEEACIDLVYQEDDCRD